ncbi:MAG TPA: hypothetical protein VJB90_03880 [Candidatus Nanoarchaeia archaeon]|nr:hypothetical protein [Candidatus Nanoarchaeia archaeon]
MNPTVVSETPINLSELKEEIEKIKKRDPEINMRVGRIEEYTNAFMPLTAKKGKELFDKLVALNIPRMKEQYYHKIIDILPTNMNTLKAVLRSYPITISNDNIKKILDVVIEYAEK